LTPLPDAALIATHRFKKKETIMQKLFVALVLLMPYSAFAGLKDAAAQKDQEAKLLGYMAELKDCGAKLKEVKIDWKSFPAWEGQSVGDQCNIADAMNRICRTYGDDAKKAIAKITTYECKYNKATKVTKDSSIGERSEAWKLELKGNTVKFSINFAAINQDDFVYKVLEKEL
jgi:hypothetical protein